MDLLVLRVGGLEVLVAVASGTATGFRQPQCGVVGGANQVIAQVRQTVWQRQLHHLRGKLHGDVDFAAAAKRASWITPVPGGVGPMTRVAMLENTLMAAERRAREGEQEDT